MSTNISAVVASILAGDGGNTIETVASRLALLGHAPGRFTAAEWVRLAVRCGDALEAIALIGDYARDVRELKAARLAVASAELFVAELA